MFKQRLGITSHDKIYGEKLEANILKFRPFGCRAYVHLNKYSQKPGKHTPRAVEAIQLGFASDCNASLALSEGQSRMHIPRETLP